MNKENLSEKIPNALLIGAQKAGTTSLFDWIAQHPQVLSSPAVKDFPYFWHDENYGKGISELTRFFPERHDEKVVLAGNVNDMFFEQSAARIKALNPEMRLIVCLRNPLERAESAYRHAVERGFENRSFADAIKEELRGGGYANLLDQISKYYVAHGYYCTQIERYLSLFDRNRLHVVIFDDIKKDPDAVMRGIFRFLAIDEEFRPRMNKKNETKGSSRFFLINKYIYRVSIQQPWWYRQLKRVVNSGLRARLRSAFDRINRKASPISVGSDEMTRKLLCDEYKEEINRLSLLLARDLTCWLK